MAHELNLPFLGEVPINASIREYGDAGRMMALLTEENPARDSLRAVCQNVAMQVARNLTETPAAPTLGNSVVPFAVSNPWRTWRRTRKC